MSKSKPHRKATRPPRRTSRRGLLGRLTSGLAHDFNNVLTALEGHLDLAAALSEDGSELRSCLDRARRCSDRAATLTRRLLDVSRPERFSPRPIRLHEAVESAVGQLRPSLGPAVELRLETEGSRVEVLGDRGQIEQALINLMLNAERAMPEGGRLSVRLGESEPDREMLARQPWTRPGRYAHVDVHHTGPAISYADQPHVFEPVAGPPEDDVDPAFGLSIVYGIVKQHRGYINVRSHPGEGVTFRVLLPLAEPPPSAARSPRPPVARDPGQAPTVLLVEDEEMIRDLARTALMSQGYEVLAAASAREAEALFDAAPGGVDLLLTDMVLPGRTGRDLARALRQRDGALRVVYTTGYDVGGLPDELTPDDGSPLLQKPFTLSELVLRVREALGAGR